MCVRVFCRSVCTDGGGAQLTRNNTQVYRGTFGVTARATEQSAQNFTLTIVERNYAILASPGGHAVYMRWVATDNFVTLADLGATVAGISCPQNQLAKYEVVWSDKCNALSLRQIADPCPHRGGLLRGKRTANEPDVPLKLELRPCVEKFACGEVVPNMEGMVTGGVFKNGQVCAKANKCFVDSRRL